MKQMLNIVIATLTLSACTVITAGFYEGESVTYDGDNILRNDVSKQIFNAEKIIYRCYHLETIQARILTMNVDNGLSRVSEEWEVTACGKQHVYDIFLNELPDKSVNFTLRLPPKVYD